MASERQREANRRNGAKRGPLSDEVRERLRQAALQNRPWEQSTGPRTEYGKAVASQNALKSGLFTEERRAWRQDALTFIRRNQEFRGGLRGGDVGAMGDLAGLIGELSDLARQLAGTGRGAQS